VSDSINFENEPICDLICYLSVLCKDVLRAQRGLIEVTSQWTEENHRSTKARTFRRQVVVMLAIMRGEATSTCATPFTRIMRIGLCSLCTHMWEKCHNSAMRR
jgi:hypothetical protein